MGHVILESTLFVTILIVSNIKLDIPKLTEKGVGKYGEGSFYNTVDLRITSINI